MEPQGRDEFIAMKMLTRFKQLRREDPNKPQPDIGWMIELLQVVRNHSSTTADVPAIAPTLRQHMVIFELPDGRLASIDKYTRDVMVDVTSTTKRMIPSTTTYIHYQCLSAPYDFGVLDIRLEQSMPQRYRLDLCESTPITKQVGVNNDPT